MIEAQIKENIEKFKQEHLDWIKSEITSTGKLDPSMCILALDVKKDKMGLVLAPIIGDFSGGGKEEFIKKIIPDLFDQVNQKGLKPYCFSFSSEIYIRIASTDNEEDMLKAQKDWRTLNTNNGIMVTFESDYEDKIDLYLTNNKGMAINKSGKMIDNIELVPFEVDNSTYLIPTDDLTNVFKKYARK